jgi:hypothetical protein
MDQIGRFRVKDRVYRAAAAFFILAEADAVVRAEGPWAVLVAALAVLLVIAVRFRRLSYVLISFGSLLSAFVIFLALATLLDLKLNLFSITVLPSVFGIGVDGTVHMVYRCAEADGHGAYAEVLKRVGGAILIAAMTTAVAFGALIFQDNPGVASIGWLATVGVLVVCNLSALTAGVLLTIRARRKDARQGPSEVGDATG